MTVNLDVAVRPFPILQIINLVLALVMLAWEWPLGILAGSSMHRSLEMRLAVLPVSALAAVLIYQGTNAAIYYVIGMFVYFWAYSEGEVRQPDMLKQVVVWWMLILALDHLREAMDPAATGSSWSCLKRIEANVCAAWTDLLYYRLLWSGVSRPEGNRTYSTITNSTCSALLLL